MSTYEKELDEAADLLLSAFHDDPSCTNPPDVYDVWMPLANLIAQDEMGFSYLDREEDESAESQYYQILNEVFCNLMARMVIKSRAFQKKETEG